LRWFEERLNTGPQNWKRYAVSLLLFNTIMFMFGYLVLANELQLALAPIAGLLGVLIGRWATHRWRSRRLPPSPRSHSRLASTNS